MSLVVKMKKKILSFDSDLLPNFFYQAISIYLKKTQVVNRKLSCSTNIVFLKINLLLPQDQSKTNLVESFKEKFPENVTQRLDQLGIEFLESELDKLKSFSGADDGIYLSIDRMTPRNLQKFETCYILTLIGRGNLSVALIKYLTNDKLHFFRYKTNISNVSRVQHNRQSPSTSRL